MLLHTHSIDTQIPYHFYIMLIFGVGFFFCFVVQLLNHVWLLVTPWTAAHQASLSLTISWSLPKFMYIELVMLSNQYNLSLFRVITIDRAKMLWLKDLEGIACRKYLPSDQHYTKCINQPIVPWWNTFNYSRQHIYWTPTMCQGWF